MSSNETNRGLLDDENLYGGEVVVDVEVLTEEPEEISVEKLETMINITTQLPVIQENFQVIKEHVLANLKKIRS